MNNDCSSSDCAQPLDEHPEVAPVLRGSLADLQRAGERLERHGIDSALMRSESDDGKGCCTTNIYLVVARDQVAAAMEVFDSDWKRGLNAEQVAACEAAAAIVLDPEAAETTCPACLTTFATGPTECPDCGLAIG